MVGSALVSHLRRRLPLVAHQNSRPTTAKACARKLAMDVNAVPLSEYCAGAAASKPTKMRGWLSKLLAKTMLQVMTLVNVLVVVHVPLLSRRWMALPCARHTVPPNSKKRPSPAAWAFG